MDGVTWWATVHGVARVRHDWATSLSFFTFMHWRRKWQPTPVFLPGESQGREAWWAAVYGVTQSQTRLKRRSSSSKLLKINNYFSTLNPSQRTEILQSSLLTYSSIYLVQWFFSKSSQILLTQWISSKDIIFSVFNPSKAKLLVSSQRIYFSHL